MWKNKKIIARKSFVELTILKHFNKKFYLERYPDVAKSKIDPMKHFLLYGWHERRWPREDFDTAYYLEQNPDVAEAGVNPFFHYLTHGIAEGRSPVAVAGDVNEGRDAVHPGGYRAEFLRDLNSIEERVMQWTTNRVASFDSRECLHEILFSVIESNPNGRVIISYSHDDYQENSGGIQSCVLEEQGLINDRGDIYLHMSPAQPLPVLAPPDEQWGGKLIVDGKSYPCFRGDDLLAELSAGLAGRSVIFIIHAIHGHRPEWLESLYEAVKPTEAYFWVHDYFSICPGFNLLRNDISYCSAPDVNSNGCQLCVYGELREVHLKRFQSLFAAIPFSIVAPSQSALDLWLSKSKLPYKNTVVHEHRILEPGEAENQESNDNPVRIAFLGLPVFHKGWFTFKELVRNFGGDSRYRFYHLGLKPDPILDVKHVEVRVSSEMPDAMQRAIRDKKIDVVLIISIWPETFCLTAYEAVAGGAIVVTTESSGNVVRMVRDGGQGLVVASDKELIDRFRSDELVNAARASRKRGRRFYHLVPSGITASMINKNITVKNGQQA